MSLPHVLRWTVQASGEELHSGQNYTLEELCSSNTHGWKLSLCCQEQGCAGSAQSAKGPAKQGPSYLPNHGAPIVDQLGQHHGHIVVNGGRVVCPLSRVAHKCAQGKDSCTTNLQGVGTGNQQSRPWLAG
jgi:hypothetical protein